MTAIQEALSSQPSRAMIAAYCENEEETEARYNLALSRSQRTTEAV